MKVAVIGAGAWGTALAKLLVEAEHDVVLWSHRAEGLKEIASSRRFESGLPGVELPVALRFESDLERAIGGRDFAVVSVPSKVFRSVCLQMAGFGGIVVSTSKGIELETGFTMCDIIRETVPGAAPAALSGPSLALEVARRIPTACVAAAADQATAQAVQALFHCPAFRIYTNTDLQGVELGGALKNIFAIAAGVGDGLGFGDNAKASLITRALAEMRRLGVACGARSDTFSGLSGLGDLTVTCFSKLSRNRCFGERLGRGGTVAEILAETKAVVEGYPTAKSARQLALRLGVDAPIIDEVHAMLYEAKPAKTAVRDLTARESKAED